MIFGIIVGVGAFIIMNIVLVYYCKKKKANKDNTDKQTNKIAPIVTVFPMNYKSNNTSTIRNITVQGYRKYKKNKILKKSFY